MSPSTRTALRALAVAALVVAVLTGVAAANALHNWTAFAVDAGEPGSALATGLLHDTLRWALWSGGALAVAVAGTLALVSRRAGVPVSR